MILSVELGEGLFFHMLAYSTILLGFIRLFKRVVDNYCPSVGESTRQILGNAIGTLIGACIMLLLEGLFSNLGDITVIIILSSVMAFFVLGTISPIMHTHSLGYKKPSDSLMHRNYKSLVSK